LVRVTQVDWHHAYIYLRGFLEILYFVSCVGIAAFAFLGLRQIGLATEQVRAANEQLRVANEELALTKKIAETDAIRESVKLAADQCRYFAEKAVPVLRNLIAEYQKSGSTFLSVKRNYNLANGELTCSGFDPSTIAKDMTHVPSAVDYLNALESFAIPFAASIADEDIGFKETVGAFCAGVFFCLPVLMFIKATQRITYPSVLALLERWLARVAKEDLRKLSNDIQQTLKNFGGPDSPPTIGTKL
jgi:hypothetical protein